MEIYRQFGWIDVVGHRFILNALQLSGGLLYIPH
jgi:hypothetical protein